MYSKVFGTRKGEHSWMERTICEIHRAIYDHLYINLAEKDPVLLDVLTPLLEEAYLCGIKMTQRLVENKVALPDWESHESPEEVTRIRKLRVELARKLNEAGTER